MFFGSMPRDNGHLSKISAIEASHIAESDPIAYKYLRKLIGAVELINAKDRFCLWLEDMSPNELNTSKELQKRVQAVKDMRLASDAASTRQMANTPHLFAQRAQPNSEYIAVPAVSSENREYVPMGYFGPDVVASNALLTIPSASHFIFGLLNSKIFNTWNRAVSGRLKSDCRISQEITYNNFPVPTWTETQEKAISVSGLGILSAREKYPHSSLADLYSSIAMAVNLREAHVLNDKLVSSFYGLSNTATDSEILARLFSLYADLAEK